MSPEDPNNPGLNTKPDFSSVPLPEPSPIKSPYAPVGGTLGDVADDITQNDTNTTNTPPASEPKDKTPTPSALKEEKAAPQDAPVNSGAKEKKHFNIPKKFIIIGASALSAIILLVIVISIIVNLKDIGPGSNGKSGSLFNAKSVFVPFDENKTKYALFDGKKIGKYEYSYVSHFFDGYALVGKSGQYGIIDEAGNMTVDFDKYDSIVEYGGLYGATKDGQNELIDGQGRVIRKYTNEFDNYGEIEPASRAALTIFPEGDKKYSIYDPRGQRLAEFTSEDSPTISSTNTVNTKSTTAVLYSGGAYVYDDSGKEVQRIERNIARKYLAIDASDDRSIVALSTKPGAIKRSRDNTNKYGMMYNILDGEDDRFNASIVNGEFNEYDDSICTNLIYETSFSGGKGGYLACLYRNDTPLINNGQLQRFIDNQGKLTKYVINPSTPYSGSDIYPLTSTDYIIKEKGGRYSLYTNNQKKATFKSQSKSDQEAVKYHILNNFAGRYVVQMLSVKKIDNNHYESASVDVSFYNRDGQKACTLKKGYAVNTPRITKEENGYDKVSYEILDIVDRGGYSGYSKSSLSLVTYGNGISFVNLDADTSNAQNLGVLINDKCEEIGDKHYYSAVNSLFYGYSGDAAIMAEAIGFNPSGTDKVSPYSQYIYYDNDEKNTLKNVSVYNDQFPTVINEDFYEKYDYTGARKLLYKGKPVGVEATETSVTYVLTDTCLVVYHKSGNSSSNRVTYVVGLDGKIIYTDKK